MFITFGYEHEHCLHSCGFFLSIKCKEKEELKAETPIACLSAADAKSRAERLAGKKSGAIAVSQEYDEDSGEIGKVSHLISYGEVLPGLIED